jgi:glycosyltransferase involved in cell wall biosynthesis
MTPLSINMPKPKLFLAVNVDWFFLSHRLPIALEALKRGYEVTIFTIDTGKQAEIESYGLRCISLPTSRSGTNILQELKVIALFWRYYKREKPDIIHHVALKPVTYGSIVCRFLKIKNVTNALSGMGFLFANPEKVSFTRRILLFLFKIAFKNPSLKFIFQNDDDLNIIVQSGVVDRKQCHIIKGSGVSLSEFAYTPENNNGKVRFTLPARMLTDKGIEEFVKAAETVSKKHPNKAEFILAGAIDLGNKAGIPEQQIRRWEQEGHVQYIGFQTDMVSVVKAANVIVLPSYREGLPKSLIEACAIGRSIITTDVTGCRDVVTEGVNGFIVPAKDFVALATAMEKLLLHKELRFEMGKKGRAIAEKEFSIDGVIEKTFQIYGIHGSN